MLSDRNRENSVDSMLFANPLFYRASSGYTHTLVADRLWLASNSISEMALGSSYAVDPRQFTNAFKTIAVMDPYFFQTINYGATYLASIKNDLKGAVGIIDSALEFNDKSFNLLFLKMLLLSTYGEGERDFEIVKNISKKLIDSDYKKVFGSLVVEDMLEDMYILSTQKTVKKEREIEDLLWLYEKSKNPEIKERILEKLKDLGLEVERIN